MTSRPETGIEGLDLSFESDDPVPEDVMAAIFDRYPGWRMEHPFGPDDPRQSLVYSLNGETLSDDFQWTFFRRFGRGVIGQRQQDNELALTYLLPSQVRFSDLPPFFEMVHYRARENGDYRIPETGLTEGELEMLDALYEPTEEAAKRFGVSPEAVELATLDLCGKVGVSGKKELLVRALAEGWIEPRKVDAGAKLEMTDRQVLTLLPLKAADIATALSLSGSEIKDRIKRLEERFRTESRFDLFVRAIHSGYVDVRAAQALLEGSAYLDEPTLPYMIRTDFRFFESPSLVLGEKALHERLQSLPVFWQYEKIPEDLFQPEQHVFKYESANELQAGDEFQGHAAGHHLLSLLGTERLSELEIDRGDKSLSITFAGSLTERDFADIRLLSKVLDTQRGGKPAES